MKIKVNSEVGRLKKVLVHRPGLEVERHYPEIFSHTLFDDIMYVQNAQKEHDYFVAELQKNGVEVFYIEKLVAEVFDHNKALRAQFLKEFIRESGITHKSIFQALYDFLNASTDNYEFVKKVIAGVLKSELKIARDGSIESYVAQNDGYPFYIEPLPNLLFQRDPVAAVFDGMNIHNMNRSIRKREGLFYQYLFNYHPAWQNTNRHLLRDHQGTMEGGDILVLSKAVIFVGLSERTTPKAVEQFALTLFHKYQNLKAVLSIEIPKGHGTMHLDTMLTQIDHDKFLVDIEMAKNNYLTYEMKFLDGTLKIKQATLNLQSMLKKYAHPHPQIFIVGNNEIVAGKAEQWNDGANCLTFAPGTIFAYDRNVHTNNMLEQAGIKLIKIPSGELSRGRGGPRCMAMPLERE